MNSTLGLITVNAISMFYLLNDVPENVVFKKASLNPNDKHIIILFLVLMSYKSIITSF